MHGPRPQRPPYEAMDPFVGQHYNSVMTGVLPHELTQSPGESPLESQRESPASRPSPPPIRPGGSPREPPSSRESPTDSFSDIGSDPLMEVPTVVPFSAPPVEPSATPSELYDPHSDYYEEPSNLHENSYETSYEYFYVDGFHIPAYQRHNDQRAIPRDETVYFEATDHSLISYSPQNLGEPPLPAPHGVNNPEIQQAPTLLDPESPGGPQVMEQSIRPQLVRPIVQPQNAGPQSAGPHSAGPRSSGPQSSERQAERQAERQPERQSERRTLRRPMRYTPGPPSEDWEELDDDIDSEPTTPVSSPPSGSRSVSPKPDVYDDEWVPGGVVRQRRLSHINDLPDEVINNIFSYISQPLELLNVALTQRRWFPTAVARLWTKPVLTSIRKLHKLVAVLENHSARRPTSTDYGLLIQRLSLNHLSYMLNYELLQAFAPCVNLQRLSLANCLYISDVQCAMVFWFLPNLESIDLQNTNVGNLTVMSLAAHCEIQTLLLGCPNLHDSALVELGEQKGKFLRRLRLADCPFVTFKGILGLAVRCPRLVELNVAELVCCADRQTQDAVPIVYRDPGFTNTELREIFKCCSQLKELLVSNCVLLNSDLFAPWSSGVTMRRLENLRYLSLVGSSQLTDSAVRHLVAAAPRLRQINLSKCPFITDRSLSTIANAYRSQLVHLHLGHCESITDKGVRVLVEKCPRLNFFDAGNCKYLTDASLYALATLPKLRRIGLVRCPNIGHQGVISLAVPQPGVPERPLERLHLSYCPKVTLESVLIITNYCKRLVHLSLTGIPCFLTEDILSLRRAPPEEFTAHQRDMFCVFSGVSIKHLRNLLNTAAAIDAQVLNERERTW